MKMLSYLGDNSPELTSRLLTYFSEENIQKGIQYGQRGFLVSFISKIINFGLLGFLVFTMFGVKIEQYLNSKTGNRYYLTVLLFVLLLSVGEFLISLPFLYYFGFILEHQFGFSKMNFVEWVFFTLKSASLGLVFAVLIALIVAFTLKTFTKTWKYLIPAGSLVIGLLFSILFPILITPIFYDYKPIAKGSLKNKIVLLCEKAHITVENVYVIDESKYSGHTNAYFTGWGENRKIFLYDTLIQNHTEKEVISVLGHEIGHWTHNHVVISLIGNTVEIFLLCWFIGILFQYLKKTNVFGIFEIHSPSSWPLLFFIVSLLSTVSNPFWNTLSRYQESEADREALVLTNDKASFINTEIKMAKDNFSRLNPHPWVVAYFYSHPMTIDRIQMGIDYKEKE